MSNKKFSFFFHYNKPASRAAKRPIWSVHAQKVCQIVDDIVCKVPCHSRSRKKQPFAVMAGKASTIYLAGRTAHII